ncbi:hypothetical protein CDL15_Pgr027168 [Punica granatum]|uniref:Uncharacterized protein n=1 Tax=Punica granatum TaxID=22663 RepID=A0A218XB83_PUNGR|nr:hypothetical protein CDL15_Pgr027168 [Punica granatum]
MGSTLPQAKRIHAISEMYPPFLFHPPVGVGCLELIELRAWSPAVLEEESSLDSWVVQENRSRIVLE